MTDPAAPTAGGAGGADPDQALEHELAAIRNTPAAYVVGNHAIQLFELARIHLTGRPPDLEAARLAIDAMAALVEGLAGRLGEDEQTLVDGLAQIRLAFVQLSAVGGAGGAPPAP